MVKRNSSPKAIANFPFVGTVIAAIARVAIGGVFGVSFYVTASITNMATCYCIGYDDVLARRDRFRKKHHYSAESYAREKLYMDKNIKTWEVINCVIFGALALIGCFKPSASFLPLIYIVLRYPFSLVQKQIIQKRQVFTCRFFVTFEPR